MLKAFRHLGFLQAPDPEPAQGSQALDAFPHVEMVKNKRAKRLILRKNKKGTGFRLTVPPYTSKAMIVRFLNAHQEWMNEKQSIDTPIPFANNIMFHYLGRDIRIVHENTSPRGVTTMRGDCLYVHGFEGQINARVVRYLKKQARDIFTQKAHAIAAPTRKKISKVTIRDTSSRWGSCTSDGHISLSWRLLLSPEWVCDYVIAHEVAHLTHMDHSADFWQLCKRLAPQTERAKKWLNENGNELHLYGNI